MRDNWKAWNEGRRAGLDGEPKHKNPYLGAEFEAWRLGWQTAQEDKEQDRSEGT